MNRSDDTFSQPGGQPDPHWQRVFDDAFETPPPRVWEGVERQLDLDDDDGILPLWQHREGRQAMLFGRWTAGIAASLALTLIGWWAWHRENAIRPDVPAVAVTTATGKPGHEPMASPAEAVSTRTTADAVADHAVPLPTIDHRLASHYREGRSRTETVPLHTFPGAAYASVSPLASPAPGVATDQLMNVPERIARAQVTLTAPAAAPIHWDQQALINELTQVALTQNSVTHSFSFQSQLEQSAQGFTQTIQRTTRTYQAWVSPAYAGSTLPMAGPSVQQTLVGFSQRGPAATLPAFAAAGSMARSGLMHSLTDDRVARTTAEQPATEPVSSASKSRKPRTWLSIGVATSAFNPAVAIRSAAMSAAATPTMVADNRAVSSVQSQPGRAVAVQASVGIPVGERWSLETGVGYLTGKHDVQSPARLTATGQLNSATTLYTDLVVRSVGQAAAVSYAVDPLKTSSDGYAYNGNLANVAASYNAGQSQRVSNTYQFVQVPVQVGYELRPRRKFGLALLTGLVSNWFVKNTVAESVTVKATDGVYRPVTLAGSAGVRLRYRPDSQWSASMAGTFQQNLQSLTRSDVSLQAQPQQVGISFSVDRQF